ncbi:MAG: 50S ribosomal protein L4 [Myxococcota bacterium]
MKLDVVNTKNEKVSDIELSDAVFQAVVREYLFWEVVKMERANLRRGTHSTKTVSEVSGSKKKPYKQKGTGRARHGTNYAMNMRGGGIVFGPKPRDYSYQVPKKVFAQAIRCALSLRLSESQLKVVEDWSPESPKTKEAQAVLAVLGAPKALVVDIDGDNHLYRSVRNLEGVSFSPVEELRVYDILGHDTLVLTRAAAQRLNEKYHTGLSRKERELREVRSHA